MSSNLDGFVTDDLRGLVRDQIEDGPATDWPPDVDDVIADGLEAARAAIQAARDRAYHDDPEIAVVLGLLALWMEE